MVDSRSKGARAETIVKDKLKELTGLPWERVPGSGALDAKHQLKGDLYLVGEKNLYCVEVKHYADDSLTSSILTAKDPQLLQFWEQTIRESGQVGKLPLLIFKHDRSKLFVAFDHVPSGRYRHIYICAKGQEFYVALLEDWFNAEQPKFIA